MEWKVFLFLDYCVFFSLIILVYICVIVSLKKNIMDDKMKDFLTFKKMITPMIIQILFWIGVAAAVIGGFVTMFSSGGFWQGLLAIILGPIFVRLFTELLIVTFSINDSLRIIKNNTKKDAE